MARVSLQLISRPVDAADATESTSARPFPPYTELPRHVPRHAWRYIRTTVFAGYVALIVTLVVDRVRGLDVFWNVVVPLLPALFFVAPGVWRNLCPLAAANQVPRRFAFTRGLTAPKWLRERGHLVAITAFLVAVGARRAVLNTNGPVLAAVLAVTVTAAFAGGLAYKGKSGWCSSMCPLLPVQRLYGQTPFVTSPNSHCEPCIGCTKNCYDFNPAVAYQADLTDAEPDWGASRRLFAGLFPGVVFGYFLVPGPATSGYGTFYLRLAATVAASCGLYFAAQAVTRLSWSKVSALWGATAFATFYWFASPVLAHDLTRLTGGGPFDWLRWPLRIVAMGLAVSWLGRTFDIERRFRALVSAAPALRLDEARLRQLQEEATPSTTPRVSVQPEGREILTQPGMSLLDVLESADLPIEAGCRMGVCGADPVAIRAGHQNLGPVTADETATLRRLCLADGTRLACQATVIGDCTIGLVPDKAGASRPTVSTPLAAVDPDLRRVVIIGGGIAGVTAAEKLRGAHPQCDISVVGQEAHHLYNRMGISRVIYGRSAMSGLYLVQDDWFTTQNIDSWLNTVARSIDLAGHTVRLATGDTLEWDKLILATGSRPVRPEVPGFDLPGSFALREAGDAAGIRAYAQSVDASTAVVAGGGLLGLEAAYALHRLGQRVTVLERAERLLARQIDERASELLLEYLTASGIAVRTRSTVAALRGVGRVEEVELADGTSLPAQLFLAAVGVTPNAEIARNAGLTVHRGVVVDAQMRTSAPDVLACGDVAERAGRTWGLWPTAVRQAEVAAATVLGFEDAFDAVDPPMILKGVGIELASAGSLEATADAEVLTYEDDARHTYARLVIRDGRISGGILLGYKREVAHLQRLVTEHADIEPILPRLRAGDIAALAEQSINTQVPAS